MEAAKLQRSYSTNSSTGSSSSSDSSRPPALPSRATTASNNGNSNALAVPKRRPPLIPPPPIRTLEGQQQQQQQQQHRHHHHSGGRRVYAVQRSNSMDRQRYLPASGGDLSLPQSSSSSSSHHHHHQQQQRHPQHQQLGFGASPDFAFGGAFPPSSLLPSSGRHSHEIQVRSPTREALAEHDLREQHSHAGTNTMHARELDELRSRCLQMEKTMKWWSDCTANWRDKWSKVRSERNRYKEEAKKLASRLDSQFREVSSLRGEKERLEKQLGKMEQQQRHQVDRPDAFLFCSNCRCSLEAAGAAAASASVASADAAEVDLTVTSADFMTAQKSPPAKERQQQRQQQPGSSSPSSAAAASASAKRVSPSAVSESVDSGLNQNSLETQSVEHQQQAASTATTTTTTTDKSADDNDDDASGMDRLSRFLDDVAKTSVDEQASMLKFRLDEALKTVDMERKAKQSLLSQLESLQMELSTMEGQCDELRMARKEDARVANLEKVQCKEEIRSQQLQLEDQLTKKGRLDQVIGHLREELERLQSENAAEWGRRERLETEKQDVERENRQIRMQNEELKERNRRLTAHVNEQASSEMARLQSQADASSKELVELRHQHGRLRKSHSEKLEELQHCQRKSESFEKEVRKLRARVDELKSELGRAQDENDEGANAVRRLQRTNEELMSQAEGYQVQIEHLTSRLRALPQTNNLLPLRRPSRFLAASAASGDAASAAAAAAAATAAFAADQGMPGPGGLPHLQQHQQHPHPDFSSSEESIPIFDDDDDDDELDLTHEIETDV